MMRTIRAAEIGVYLYCRRAWWYRLQGFEPENIDEMVRGRKQHERHGWSSLAVGWLRAFAYFLIISAIFLATIELTLQFIQ